MSSTPPRLAAWLLAVLSFALLATAAGLVPKASAADRIFWTNDGDETIRAASLAGGGSVDILYGSAQGVSRPVGLALDRATGHLYWSNQGDDTIRGAPLGGSGPVDTLYNGAGELVSAVVGVALDPAAARIYWANFNGASRGIHGAPLSGGGPADTLYDDANGANGPRGVAVDPDGGRIYWTNFGSAAVRCAPLAGGGTVDTLYQCPRSLPYGVAVDPGAARIYWDCDDGTIRTGPLAGGVPADVLYSSVGGPRGLAIDPLAGRIYWAGGDNTIGSAPLAGGGPVETLYSGAAGGVNNSQFLAVLRAPVGTVPPAIARSGRQLSCGQGSWAPDFVASFVYSAPTTFAFQWLRDGSDVGGATAATYSPMRAGSYSCRVTASNGAGGRSQTSAAIAVASDPKCRRLGKKLKRQRHRLRRAGTEAKHSSIEQNIADSHARLRRLGC
ncbi:MAG: hypothetical protein ACJ75Z_07140 [Solirubrobacterales bacterium]